MIGENSDRWSVKPKGDNASRLTPRSTQRAPLVFRLPGRRRYLDGLGTCFTFDFARYSVTVPRIAPRADQAS